MTYFSTARLHVRRFTVADLACMANTLEPREMEIGFTLAREHLTAPRSPDHAPLPLPGGTQ